MPGILILGVKTGVKDASDLPKTLAQAAPSPAGTPVTDTAPITEPEVESLVAELDAPDRLPVSEALEAWERLRRQLASHLREESLDGAWLHQFTDLARDLRTLADNNPDLALYLLIHAAGAEISTYSAQHGMACAVVAELAARWLAWPEDEVESLVHAALSMNVSMTAMQDTLARQTDALTVTQRETVQGHAQASAEMLAGAGVQDSLWLQTVRDHHRVAEIDGFDADADTDPAVRMAELLRRIDIYTAKLSRRGSRAAASPTVAARDACLGPGGQPDSIGATLLRVLGLYPPGTWVALANGDHGIVVARGPKAHTPVVAAIRRGDGGLLMRPLRCDTQERAYAVVRGLGSREAQVRLNHRQVLSC